MLRLRRFLFSFKSLPTNFFLALKFGNRAVMTSTSFEGQKRRATSHIACILLWVFIGDRKIILRFSTLIK